MNAVTNFILLAILTLVASRHVHAYRIARRRRTGDRTNRRTPTTDSFHIPQCDPTCCNPSICLKYLIQPQKLCVTDARRDQVRAPVAPEREDFFLPFADWTTAVRPYSLPGASPPRPSHNFLPLTKEEEFIARSRFGRYFLRKDELPPLSNYNDQSWLGHPTLAGTASKRTDHGGQPLCPRVERWSDLEIAFNGGQPLQIVQLADERQWFLEEQCVGTESPIVRNVQCVQKPRQVIAIVVDRTHPDLFVRKSINIECCVAVRRV